MKFTKPSQIWKWASKNLNQATYYLYNKEMDSYCALGAIGKVLEIDNESLSKGIGTKTIMAFDNTKGLDADLRTIYGEPIVGLNDNKSWSFELFADVAKRLGY